MSQERHRIFEKQLGRKIIVSTNIAELDLTINDVRYMIDSGFVYMNEYDPVADITKLVVTSLAQGRIFYTSGKVVSDEINWANVIF